MGNTGHNNPALDPDLATGQHADEPSKIVLGWDPNTDGAGNVLLPLYN